MTLSGFAAYVKQIWKNTPDTSTPLSADRLSHMEDGIKANSDAVEQIAESVIHTYTSFDQLGIAVGEETILGIATAMPDNSELRIAVSSASGNNTEIYPTAYGTLYVKRTSETRIYFEFSRAVNEVSADSGYTTVWRGEANASTGTWDGWKKVFDDSNLPTPEQIGALYVIDFTGATNDLDVLIKSGVHCGFYQTDGNTLGTPAKEGVTSLTTALVLSFARSSTFAVQYAFVSGTNNGITWCRTMQNGTISKWTSYETHHNIKSYTSLTQLGLSDSDFGTSADDFGDNMAKINAATNDAFDLYMYMSQASTYPNLRACILNKLNAEGFGLSTANTGNMNLFVRRVNSVYNNMVIDVMYEPTGAGEQYCYSTVYNYDTNGSGRTYPFQLSKSRYGFLEKCGGVVTGATRMKASAAAWALENPDGTKVGFFKMFDTGTLQVVSADAKNGVFGSTNTVQLLLYPADVISNITRRLIVGWDGNTYKVFGDHNKPTGTYTGDGTSTSRTISTGGVGNLLLIHSSNGMALVTPYGAICKTASGTTTAGLANTACKYVNGVLTIASTSTYVNASGVTYSYQCI